MERFNTRLIRAGMFLLTALLLGGCTTLSSPLPTAEPVVIRFVVIGEAEGIPALIETFQKENPKISIQLETMNFFRQNEGESFADLIGEIDVLRSDMRFLSPEALGAFLPLDALIEAEATFQKDDLFPGTLEAFRLDGVQLGVPAGLNPYVAFYDSVLFERAGVQPPSINWTLDDFLNAAKAVNNQTPESFSAGSLAYGVCSSPRSFDPIVLAYLFGGGLFDDFDTPTQPTLNTPENVAALEWYVALKRVHNLFPPDEGNTGGFGAGTASQGTLCGLWLQWFDSGIQERVGMHEIKMLPLPIYSDRFNVVWVDGYHIPSMSKHPQEAWKWISFLVKNQAASGDLVPPMRSQIESIDYAQRVSASALAVARSLGPETRVLKYSLFSRSGLGNAYALFLQAVDQSMTQGILPDVALDEAQVEAEKIMAQPTPTPEPTVTPTPP